MALIAPRRSRVRRTLYWGARDGVSVMGSSVELQTLVRVSAQQASCGLHDIRELTRGDVNSVNTDVMGISVAVTG